MQKLEQEIGYKFKNEMLLKNALTHTSYANEVRTKQENNERLEFLGDAVLQMVTADYLYTNKKMSEGELTRIRANLVCEGALCNFAREIKLGEYLFLGKGEQASGGRDRQSILADAFEALIAALYLDGGIDCARRFILPFFKNAMAKTVKDEDYKTQLQEIIQQNKSEKLSYILAQESGPDHNKHFVVQVFINSNCIGIGAGNSKKLAEQAAAKEALSLMGY